MLHIYKLDTQLQYEYQSRQKVKKQVRINLVVCSQILFKTLCWYFTYYKGWTLAMRQNCVLRTL